MKSFGNSFPRSNLQQGHIHEDSVTGLIYRYLGGDPSDILNWLVDGGRSTKDPSTSGWSNKHVGANWYNTALKSSRNWDGAITASIGSGGGSSGLDVLDIVNVSGSTFDIESFVGKNYRQVKILLSDLAVTVDNAHLTCQLKYNGVYKSTSNYRYNILSHSSLGAATNTTFSNVGTNAPLLSTALTWGISNAALDTASVEILIDFPEVVGLPKFLKVSTILRISANAIARVEGTIVYDGADATTALQGLRIATSSGTVVGNVNVVGML